MAKAQAKPQSESYTKRADSKKSAKPAGARFTNKLAKRLGKKNPKTRPTLAEIDKYLGKGVYKENRKDKSDINPKQKLELGGENPDEKLKVTIQVDVYEDDYEEGEGKNVNSYTGLKNSIVKANDLIKFLADNVSLSDDPNDYVLDDNGFINTSRLENADGSEASEYEIEKWKKGEMKLYSAHYTIIVQAIGKPRTPSQSELHVVTDIPMYAKGGKTKQTAPQSDVYNEFRDLTKKAKPVGWRYTNKGAKALKVKNPFARPSKAHIDKYGNSERGYLDFETRADKTDEKPNERFAKGGQTPPQGENYSRSRDKEKSATRVGWRYSQGLAKRLGIKNPQTKTPTQEHIDKYQDAKKNSVYWEGRADKSDMNPKSKFEEGGENEYEAGGKITNQYKQFHGVNFNRERQIWNAWTPAQRLHFLLDHADELGKKNFDIEPKEFEKISRVKYDNLESLEDRDDMMGGEYFVAVNSSLSRHIKRGQYAKGGQAPSYKETYFGNVWSKKNDKEDKAKPVGYRYTEKLAKRLGKSPYAKVTPEHKEKYLGRGVYFENRKDKSDINPNQKLASGGKVKQTEPQSDVYNEFRDLTKSAKPVGWRYTDKGAKALKVDPFAKPSKAHIDKYGNSERGYLDYETRLDKSDEKPKAKFEGGGENEMAKGGQARISNSEASSYAENHQPFKGNNLEAKNLENGDYVILSYGYYPIWYWNKKENKWYQNKDKFSQTTARHITASRPTYDAEVVARDEMDKMMAKSLEGHGFMAMGGDVKE